MSAQTLAKDLAAITGEEHVLLDDDLRAGYERDWTGRYEGLARLVVRPGTTDEVSRVVRACVEAGAAIVPQGGNTGLVGGSVPRGGEVVLSLRRLTRLDIDATAGQAIAGAGVTIAALQEAAEAADFQYPVDLASRDSATVGGTIATNAGGLRVLRYGPTRAQIAGIEAVLPDGSVVSRMTGLLKDNSGYDLAQLFAGSEGTLGVVTAARLKLASPTPARATALLGLERIEDALAVFAHIRGRLPNLDSIEAFFQEGVDIVCKHTGALQPFGRPQGCYLLIECAGRSDPSLDLAGALADAPHIGESAFATGRAERQALWRYREAHTESINREGIPHKLDVTLPLDRLAEFEGRVRTAVATSVEGARAILFGHLGDGNLHVNVLGPEPHDDRATDAVLRLVADLGGSISAEHGIGVAKAPWLHLTRSAADLAAMRSIKKALDARGMLNPGVIFPPG